MMKHKFDVLKAELWDDITLCKNFGMYIALVHFVMKVIFQGGKTAIGRKLYKYIYCWVERRFSKEYKDFILAFDSVLNECSIENKIERNSPIWIFWWQGIEKAPEVVRICTNSVKKHAGDHRIIIVSEDNYTRYAEIPDYIIKRLKNGQITLTHFSDILRVELLYKHGGIWMDATLWLTGDIPEDIYRLPFYTIKHDKYSDWHVCRGKWSTFFFCAGKYNPLMRFCRDFLYTYWKTENSLICYLIIDVAICLAYDNYIWANKMIEDVDANNEAVFDLQSHMNQPYEEDLLHEWCKNTFAHKVSYKIPFKFKGGG